jgi:hypothetical protein
LAAFDIASQDSNFSSGGCETFGQSAAQSARGADHDRDFPRKIEEIIHLPNCQANGTMIEVNIFCFPFIAARIANPWPASFRIKFSGPAEIPRWPPDAFLANVWR